MPRRSWLGKARTVSVSSRLNATLVLVRHGESTYVAEGRFQGRQDSPLSTLGERQASLVGARLADRNADTPLPIPAGPPLAIWHSPLSRASQTAEAIARLQPDVPLTPLDDLTEIAQGEWEGQPSTVVRERWAAELAAWRRTPVTSHAPGGESLGESAARVGHALEVIIAGLARDDTDDADEAATDYPRSFVQGYEDSEASGRPVEPWSIVVAHDGIFRVVLLTLLDLPLERFWSFPFNLCAISVVAIQNGVPVLRAHNLSELLAPIAAEARAAAEARGDRRGAL
jgi:probable phosphoglycerate mutase